MVFQYITLLIFSVHIFATEHASMSFCANNLCNVSSNNCLKNIVIRSFTHCYKALQALDLNAEEKQLIFEYSEFILDQTIEAFQIALKNSNQNKEQLLSALFIVTKMTLDNNPEIDRIFLKIDQYVMQAIEDAGGELATVLISASQDELECVVFRLQKLKKKLRNYFI